LEKKREQQRMQLEMMAQTVNMPLEQLLITFQGEAGQNLLKMRLLELASKSENTDKIFALISAIQPEAFKVVGEMYSAKHQAELREVERRNYEERLKEHAEANCSLETRNQRLEDNLQVGQERTAEFLTEALRTNRDMGVAAVSRGSSGGGNDSSAAGARACPFCGTKSINVKKCECGYNFQ
jgi:hypothetical protein